MSDQTRTIMTEHQPLSIPEVFGLKPYAQTLQQARMVFKGDPNVPPSRFDTTSLGIMTPRLSIGTWMGIKMGGRTIPLLSLFNHNQTPIREGWSTRVTQVRDFRGRYLTYDSHNGTDFVIPPGTITTAATSGRLVSIRQEFNRGGLKLYMDHGQGLMTTYNHLGRALINIGDVVEEGEPIALTGYSGIDGLTGFPWLAPHVHWNAILGGVLVDPFGLDGQESLWRQRNDPKPYMGQELEPYSATTFPQERIEAMLNDLQDAQRREELVRSVPPWRLPFELIIEATVYPTRFATHDAGQILFETPPERRPRLSLPFRAEDFDGVGFADDMGFRTAAKPQ